jgi:hypothetical protein
VYKITFGSGTCACMCIGLSHLNQMQASFAACICRPRYSLYRFQSFFFYRFPVTSLCIVVCAFFLFLYKPPSFFPSLLIPSFSLVFPCTSLCTSPSNFFSSFIPLTLRLACLPTTSCLMQAYSYASSLHSSLSLRSHSLPLFNGQSV